MVIGSQRFRTAKDRYALKQLRGCCDVISEWCWNKVRRQDGAKIFGATPPVATLVAEGCQQLGITFFPSPHTQGDEIESTHPFYKARQRGRGDWFAFGEADQLSRKTEISLWKEEAAEAESVFVGARRISLSVQAIAHASLSTDGLYLRSINWREHLLFMAAIARWKESYS